MVKILKSQTKLQPVDELNQCARMGNGKGEKREQGQGEGKKQREKKPAT